MSKIPKKALPVRDYIREKVRRPAKLPNLEELDGSTALAWKRPNRKRWGFRDGSSPCCPLGLLRTSIDPWPAQPEDLGVELEDLPFDKDHLGRFVDWWDSQTDPQEAVNAVWGPAS